MEISELMLPSAAMNAQDTNMKLYRAETYFRRSNGGIAWLVLFWPTFALAVGCLLREYGMNVVLPVPLLVSSVVFLLSAFILGVALSVIAYGFTRKIERVLTEADRQYAIGVIQGAKAAERDRGDAARARRMFQEAEKRGQDARASLLSTRTQLNRQRLANIEFVDIRVAIDNAIAALERHDDGGTTDAPA